MSLFSKLISDEKMSKLAKKEDLVLSDTLDDAAAGQKEETEPHTVSQAVRLFSERRLADAGDVTEHGSAGKVVLSYVPCVAYF